MCPNLPDVQNYPTLPYLLENQNDTLFYVRRCKRLFFLLFVEWYFYEVATRGSTVIRRRISQGATDDLPVIFVFHPIRPRARSRVSDEAMGCLSGSSGAHGDQPLYTSGNSHSEYRGLFLDYLIDKS